MMDPRVIEAAQAIVAGRLMLSKALAENWSTSQRCLLALVAGEPGAAEEPYNSPKAAWARLNGEQQAFVRNLLGTAMLRKMGVDLGLAEEEAPEGPGGSRP